MTNQDNKRSSNGSKKSGESFKERILRELHEGNNVAKPVGGKKHSSSKVQERSSKRVAPAQEKTNGDKGKKTRASSQQRSSSTKKVPKKIQKRRQERVRRKSETSLQKEDRVVGKIIRRILIAITLFLVVLIGGIVFYAKDGLQPLDKDAKTFVTVHIPAGASNKEVSKILENDHIIKNALVFNFFAKFNNYANFQSGYYNMKASYTLDQVAKMLKKGGTQQPEKPSLGKIVIKEGQNIDDIAKQIEINVNTKEGKKTPFKSADFIALMKDEAFFKEMSERYPKLLEGAGESSDVRYRFEGHLYPATYSYEKKDTVRTMVEKSIHVMNQVMDGFYAEIAKQGKTVREVLTLASLVEREAVSEEDRRMVAQVFFNRLKIDMELKTDVAVLYALGKNKETVTIADTEVDSPYNLYQHTGVGPGPYDSPSKMSIEAVLTPKPNDYLYFLADPKTGKVYYSSTGEEHMALVDKYINHSTN